MKRWFRRLFGSRKKADDPLAAERELRAQFQGRRDGTRIRVRARVLLGNDDHPYRCETVDVSRNGVLLTFRDPRCREWDLAGYMQFLDEYLGDGAHLSMGGIERDVEIVRVTQGGLGGGDVPQFACMFEHPISTQELETLVRASRKSRA